MVHDLQQTLVGPVEVFEFHIQDRVDPMLARQKTESVFPPVSSEQSALAAGRLSVKIELGGPPRLHTIFQLTDGSPKALPVTRRGSHAADTELQVTGLLHLVRVRYEKRSLAGPGVWQKGERSEGEQRGSQFGHFQFPR